MFAKFSLEMDAILSMPLTVLRASSIFVVTPVSISDRDAPGNEEIVDVAFGRLDQRAHLARNLRLGNSALFYNTL
jgi:hypothetical protein